MGGIIFKKMFPDHLVIFRDICNNLVQITGVSIANGSQIKRLCFI